MGRLRLAYYSILIFGTAIVSSVIANADPLVVTGRNLDVILDIDACNSGFDFCTDSGSSGAAAEGNDSVVSVVVHVKTANGSPVGGLLETDFAMTSITNPAPGVSPGFVDLATCASCFLEVQTGVYRLAARPVLGDWGDGTYVALITVSSGAVSKQAVVPIEIPL